MPESPERQKPRAARRYLRQRGVAVVTVMLVIALGTITVTSMIVRQQRDFRREQNQAFVQQASALAVSGERFAAAVLFRDFDTGDRSGSDSLDDDWAQTLPPVPIDNASIEGCIVDMQGKFNLNNLVSERDPQGAVNPGLVFYQDQFRRLLHILGIDQAKAEPVFDWLDDDIDPLQNGAEDDYYSSLETPYRVRNGPMTSITELQLVKGFSPAVEEENADYDRLLPFVTVLPYQQGVFTSLNVNTAPPELIETLQDGMLGVGTDLSRWETGAYEDYPECEDLFDLSADPSAGITTGQNYTPFEDKQDFVGEAESLMNSGGSGSGTGTSAGNTATSGSGGNNSGSSGSGNNPVFDPAVNFGVTSEYFQLRVEINSESVQLVQYSLFHRSPTEGTSTVLYRSQDTL